MKEFIEYTLNSGAVLTLAAEDGPKMIKPYKKAVEAQDFRQYTQGDFKTTWYYSVDTRWDLPTGRKGDCRAAIGEGVAYVHNGFTWQILRH